MGMMVAELTKTDPEISVATGIENPTKADQYGRIRNEVLIIFPPKDHLENISDLLKSADVFLIFHNDPEAVVPQTAIAAQCKVATIIATTGLSQTQLNELRKLSDGIPILQATNFSLGVTVLNHLVNLAAKFLPLNYQTEIIEEHHSRKLDAPSGTAQTLIQAICDARFSSPEFAVCCGRQGRSDAPRPNGQIGVHSIRAGNITGNHEVVFAGPAEVLRLRHEAQGPEFFAQGALTAVKWLARQEKPGWYMMEDVLGLK
ncbi:MAG: 4-hydroxy-tetrahydrodipicolinate reductase [Candidatus Buchananbacteria bacterium RIFCSPHIGHO2_02_FULL_39_17]|nr:MAG: 4-hydroxy-tetrahydrodipicolinate reductase [Candidatus Buchananbacteria bacterium RIFCSPHIGHO2_02_FULL_39_17]